MSAKMKQICISLPEALIAAIDTVANVEREQGFPSNRSSVIRGCVLRDLKEALKAQEGSKKE